MIILIRSRYLIEAFTELVGEKFLGYRSPMNALGQPPKNGYECAVEEWCFVSDCTASGMFFSAFSHPTNLCLRMLVRVGQLVGGGKAR